MMIRWPPSFSSKLQFSCQDMIRRHKCKAISVPLGAFGGMSERLDSNFLVWNWKGWCENLVMAPASFEHTPRKRVTLYTTAPYLFALGTKIDPLQRLGYPMVLDSLWFKHESWSGSSLSLYWPFMFMCQHRQGALGKDEILFQSEACQTI